VALVVIEAEVVARHGTQLCSSMSPLLSLVVEQLNCLETRLPVNVLFLYSENYISTKKQPPNVGASSLTAPEQAVVASEILANARLIRDQLVIESADANRKLTEATLAVTLHMETVENTNHLLALAETCVGKIRARMRAHGIPIHLPSASPNIITPIPDVSGEAVQGQFVSFMMFRGHLLIRR